MPRELVHVRNDQGAGLLPGRAADAAAVADAGAGNGALERAQHQFFTAAVRGGEHAVESGPVESHPGVDGRRDVGHVGDFVGLAADQGFHFLQKLLVFSFFLCHNC